MTMTCPICGGTSKAGVACTPCWRGIERDLRAVPGLVTELDIAAARMARLIPPAPGGLASELTPVGWSAAEAAGALTNVLTTWARDVAPQWAARARGVPAITASRILIGHETAIRAHPAAAELADNIHAAVDRARRAIDRPEHRAVIPVANCPEPHCLGQLFAYIPAADDAPSRVLCRTNPAHDWTADQWLRLGRRILATKGPAT